MKIKHDKYNSLIGVSRNHESKNANERRERKPKITHAVSMSDPGLVTGSGRLTLGITDHQHTAFPRMRRQNRMKENNNNYKNNQNNSGARCYTKSTKLLFTIFQAKVFKKWKVHNTTFEGFFPKGITIYCIHHTKTS